MRRMTLTAVLGMSLALSACSGATDGQSDEATTDAAASATEAAGQTDAADESGAATEGADSAAAMSDPVCADFFQTGANPLADRAEADRALLESGDVLDPATWGEINLLTQRLVDLGETAEGDQAALIERINAPFVEASDAVLDDPEKSPTDAEIEVPEIDVTDSAAAQEEFLAACSG